MRFMLLIPAFHRDRSKWVSESSRSNKNHIVPLSKNTRKKGLTSKNLTKGNCLNLSNRLENMVLEV